MADVIEGVEANQIAVEQRFEDLVADGERAVELPRREGAVQEEADAETVESAAQEGRDGEEVVVEMSGATSRRGSRRAASRVDGRRGIEMRSARLRDEGGAAVSRRDGGRGHRMGEDEGDDEVGLCG